jgi:hypothetical protein
MFTVGTVAILAAVAVETVAALFAEVFTAFGYRFLYPKQGQTVSAINMLFHIPNGRLVCRAALVNRFRLYSMSAGLISMPT